MANLLISRVSDETLPDWQHVHNAIIPADALTLEEVRERVTRNILEVAYADAELVGCSTVRPPNADRVATVIVRVLPNHRHNGHGRTMYAHALGVARALDPSAIETIVWEPNADGLQFALVNGFVEVERYSLEDGEPAYITLRLES